MSTFALPRAKPSRKPAELSLTRFRKPASSEASRVRWLRSYRGCRRRVPVVDQIGLEPDDRLDPGGDAGLVVLDRAIHHAVVGEAERRHVQFRGAGGQMVDLAGAVEQRVLTVDVQMDRAGAHPSIMPMASERTTGTHWARFCDSAVWVASKT
jgi:hypothetical protein